MSIASLLGNLKGLFFVTATKIMATMPIDTFLNNENSTILTPSFAKYLNITNYIAAVKEKAFMAKIAMRVLSLTSGNLC